MLQEVLGKHLAGVDDMLPAIVISYDRATNLARVKPLVKILRTDGTSSARAEIASVPVFQIGGAIAVLTFNILPGDIGWIKANDRDISNFMESKEEEAPNTLRKHEFSDAVFFPDQFRKWTLDAEDAAAAVLQTLDGTQRIAIHADHIKMTSDLRIDLEAPNINLDATNNVNITASNQFNVVAGQVDIESTLNMTLDAGVDLDILVGAILDSTSVGDTNITSTLAEINLVADTRIDSVAPTIQDFGNSVVSGGFFLVFGSIASTTSIAATTSMTVGISPTQVNLGTHTHTQPNDSNGDVEQPTAAPTQV